MHAAIRNLLVVMALGLFSLTTTGAENSKATTGAVKAKKIVVDARTLDGKKPKACNFRISLS
jgi:hypothetical protein